MYLIVVFAFLIQICKSDDFIAFADITVKRIEKCGEDQNGLVLDINFNKLNRTHFGLDTHIVLPFDFDDTLTVNLTSSKWGDGGWKPNAFSLYGNNSCTFFQTRLKHLFQEAVNALNVPPTCPIPKGEYKVKNYVFGSTSTTPVMLGDYKMEISLIKDNTIVTCIRSYVLMEHLKTKG